MARFRHELKYVIDLSEADRLFEDALQYCDWDPHVTDTHSYEIASIYYDTDDLRFYYDREESVGYRRKIRLRSYNREGKSVALFIEIKEKHKQFVLKKRINLRSPDILDRYERHDVIPLEEVLTELEDTAEAREMRYLEDRLHLFPVVNIRYHRRPLIPKYENDMRITLDTRITAGGENLAQYDDDSEESIIEPHQGVFEVKTNQSIPMWLQAILRRYAITQTRYSKYCLGVDKIYGRGGKQWLVDRRAGEKSGENSGEEVDKKKESSTSNLKEGDFQPALKQVVGV